MDSDEIYRQNFVDNSFFEEKKKYHSSAGNSSELTASIANCWVILILAEKESHQRAAFEAIINVAQRIIRRIIRRIICRKRGNEPKLSKSKYPEIKPQSNISAGNYPCPILEYLE